MCNLPQSININSIMFSHLAHIRIPFACLLMTFLIAVSLGSCSSERSAQDSASPGREEVLRGLRLATEFYRTQVSNQAGYHFRYTSDLSYGRSEVAEGASQVTVQRSGTPIVGLSYLRAYEVTGDTYYLEAARETAQVLVQGQHCSGGWDYIIELDPAKRSQYPYRADRDCSERQPDASVRKPVEEIVPRREPDSAVERAGASPRTTLDDNVTQAALRLLMRVDRELQFGDATIHEAARYGLDQLALAQYPNGAWPQRYVELPDPAAFPVKAASYPDSWSRTWPGPDYRSHYTLNDNAVLDMIDTFLEAARIYGEPRYRTVAEKGGDFLLLAQMPDPQPAWAQQYDAEMRPAWGRIFEPPAVSGSESQSVLKLLLVLYRETGNKKYLEPVSRAIEYFRRSDLDVAGSTVLRKSGQCGPDELCLARFYELKSNRPLFISKGSRVRIEGGSSELLDGYEITYSDEKVITHYGLWASGRQVDKIDEEYRGLLSADPASVQRSARLQGLSPWQGSVQVPAGEELAAGVKEALASLDSRGAWVETGSIGKADNVLSLFAAEDMVVTIGAEAFPLKENQTLAVFQGKSRPSETIISSNTFARNVELLLVYLREVE